MPLIQNVLKALAKSVLIQLELTAAASETDEAIQKKMFGSGRPLSSFEIQKYYQNESKFNGVHSRNNLPKIKDNKS